MTEYLSAIKAQRLETRFKFGFRASRAACENGSGLYQKQNYLNKKTTMTTTLLTKVVFEHMTSESCYKLLNVAHDTNK